MQNNALKSNLGRQSIFSGNEFNIRVDIICMDVSGCKEPFADSQIRRFLDQKAYEGFDQLRTENEIKKVLLFISLLRIQACIKNLFHCPFCPFAAIMDNPKDRVLDCPRCRTKSCRYCRVKDHRPLKCEGIAFR